MNTTTETESKVRRLEKALRDIQRGLSMGLIDAQDAQRIAAEALRVKTQPSLFTLTGE